MTRMRLFVPALALSFGCYAAQFWWIGTASSDPMAGSSWYNGDQLPGTADEICVNDGAAKPMTITSETAFDVAAFRLGVNQSRRDNTVVMNGGTLNSRSDVTVGYYKGSGGTMTQNGGSITAAGRLNIAYGDNCSGMFRMTGGTLSVGGDIVVNEVKNAQGAFEMTGGTITMAAGKSFAVPKRGTATARVAGPNARIDFNGAYIYVAACRGWYGEADGQGAFILADGATLASLGYVQLLGADSTFTCNGGVIQTSRAGTFFDGQGRLYVGDGGLVFDTQDFNVTLGKPMLAPGGATSGGFVKKGTGKLTLSTGNTYLPGPVSIEAGTVFAPGPDALPGFATHAFSLAAGATLELGGNWSPAQVTALQKLPGVQGTVTRVTLDIVGEVTIADDLTTVDVEAGLFGNPKTGSGTLTLTGHNDFGGQFGVDYGALVADWGQGVAWTDNLRLGKEGAFGTWRSGKFAPLCGLVTNAVGTGPGEIFFPQNTEAGFVAAVQPTTVRLYDDAARALKPNVDLPRMLALNTTTLANDIHLVNPVELNNGPFVAWDVYVDAGHAYLDGGVDYTVDGVPSTAQGSLAKKGAGTLHMPAQSTFQVLYSQGGTLAYPANSSANYGWIASTDPSAVTYFGPGSALTVDFFNTARGGLLFWDTGCQVTVKKGFGTRDAGTLDAGTLVFSNSTVKVEAGDLGTVAAKLVFKGGTLTKEGIGWSYTRWDGSMVLDGVQATFAAPLMAGHDGKRTNVVNQSCLTITGGAQVKVLGKVVAMAHNIEISGDDTLLTCTQFGTGSDNLDSATNMPVRISLKGGTVKPSDDVNVGKCSGTTGQFLLSGGTLVLASGKSMTAGNAGNGTVEVSGGLLDGSEAYGLMILPGWQPAETVLDPNWKQRGIVRLLGGETRVQQIGGNSGRDCHMVFDGGRLVFVNPRTTTLFSGVNTRMIGVNGGELDTGAASLTMSGAFTALTNQPPVALTGAALNTAKAFAKSGSGTLTMVGANTYACGTAVKAGTLAVESGASLPSDQFLRVDADGVLDLGGNSQTATALLGTGKVKSGSLAVTEAVYPAGVGTVGTLTLTDVPLTGRVVIDVDASGACDKLVVNGTLDASKITFELADTANLEKAKVLRICEATSIVGKPSVANVPNNFALSMSQTGISISRAGLVFYVR